MHSLSPGQGPGRRLRLLYLSPDALLGLFRGAHPGHFASRNPLPDDATIVRIALDERMRIVMLLESEAFSLVADGTLIPEVDDPWFTEFRVSWEQFAHDHPEFFKHGEVELGKTQSQEDRDRAAINAYLMSDVPRPEDDFL
jgi:hypothetical protein